MKFALLAFALSALPAHASTIDDKPIWDSLVGVPVVEAPIFPGSDVVAAGYKAVGRLICHYRTTNDGATTYVCSLNSSPSAI